MADCYYRRATSCNGDGLRSVSAKQRAIGGEPGIDSLATHHSSDLRVTYEGGVDLSILDTKIPLMHNRGNRSVN